MSDLDVRELARENLQEDTFPVNTKSDFRLFIAPEVHNGISQHAKNDTSVEICGVLVGQWCQDEHGPFAQIEAYIRCDSATSKFAEVTFTHESWATINQEMDTRFEDKRIVGWYHSHPDFGIFLSDRDCFIHENFFSGAGQVAYVVDPVRDLEGAFAWKNGKPAAMPHYWVGDSIRTVQASIKNPAAEGKKQLAGESDLVTNHSVGYADRPLGMSMMPMLLSFLALFLTGYLLAGWRTNWERKAIVDGVVANYTNFKQVKVGLREELANVQKYLLATSISLKRLQVDSVDLTPEQLEAQAKSKKMIVASLSEIQQRLEKISELYGYSDQELKSLLRLRTRLDTEYKKLLSEQQAKDKGAKVEEAKVEEAKAKETETPLPDSKVAPPPSPETAAVKE